MDSSLVIKLSVQNKFVCNGWSRPVLWCSRRVAFGARVGVPIRWNGNEVGPNVCTRARINSLCTRRFYTWDMPGRINLYPRTRTSELTLLSRYFSKYREMRPRENRPPATSLSIAILKCNCPLLPIHKLLDLVEEWEASFFLKILHRITALK